MSHPKDCDCPNADAHDHNVFDDEDLERLKERIDFVGMTEGDILALLARLEAAEVLSNEIANIHGHSGPGDLNEVIECQLCPKIKAWRKACGKD